jgi:hypothetical protein
MSFGRRTTASTGGMSSRRVAEQPRTRKGGYWLGLLANAGASAVTMTALPFISQFKLNGATFGALIVPAIIALANIVVVAAVITLLVDLALRGLNWRRPLIYALACALAVFCFYLFLALVVGAINPIFALYVAVWPAAVGGWVLGLYRR